MKALHIMIFVGALAVGSAQAEVIKCLDKDGNVIFADTMSAECVGPVGEKETAEATGSRDESLTNDAELQRRAENARQAEADRVLLMTYLSVEEIEDVRDRRIEQIDARNYVTERYLDRLREQLVELEAAAAEQPASDSGPGGPAEIPADLEADIKSTRASIEDYEGRLAAGVAEQERIREKFAADIARFEELAGVTAGN